MWPTGVGFEHYYGFLNGETNHGHRTSSVIGSTSSPATPTRGTTSMPTSPTRPSTGSANGNSTSRTAHFFSGTPPPHPTLHTSPRVDRPIRRPLRRGWDDWRERTFAPEGDGHRPTGRRTFRSAGLGRGMERYRSRSPTALRPDDGGLRLRARRSPHRPVLDAIEASGQADNTIVVVISDNGCSAEGGPNGTWNQLRHYVSDIPDDIEPSSSTTKTSADTVPPATTWGWAFAGNTPFRRWKRGACRPVDRFVASEFGDAADRSAITTSTLSLVTLLELAGLDAPNEVGGIEQMSLTAHRSPRSSRPHRCPTRWWYYECWGSRAIYADGWKPTNHVNQLTHAERTLVEAGADFNDDDGCSFTPTPTLPRYMILAGLTPAMNISSNAGMCDVEQVCQSTTGTIASPMHAPG